jgi:hypothetical protein
MMADKVTTGGATTKDWRAATKDMKIEAYIPSDQEDHDVRTPARCSRTARPESLKSGL